MINIEYVKAKTLEHGTDEQKLHEEECHNLLRLAQDNYGFEFMDSCLDFLKVVDVAVTLWMKGNAKCKIKARL